MGILTRVNSAAAFLFSFALSVVRFPATQIRLIFQHIFAGQNGRPGYISTKMSTPQLPKDFLWGFATAA
jgi:hypothetical protein